MGSNDRLRYNVTICGTKSHQVLGMTFRTQNSGTQRFYPVAAQRHILRSKRCSAWYFLAKRAIPQYRLRDNEKLCGTTRNYAAQCATRHDVFAKKTETWRLITDTRHDVLRNNVTFRAID